MSAYCNIEAGMVRLHLETSATMREKSEEWVDESERELDRPKRGRLAPKPPTNQKGQMGET